MGISFDTVEENAAFAKKFQFNFPLLCDTDRKIGLAYGACETAQDTYAKRITFVIGEDGKILLAFPKVDSTRHPHELLEKL